MIFKNVSKNVYKNQKNIKLNTLYKKSITLKKLKNIYNKIRTHKRIYKYSKKTFVGGANAYTSITNIYNNFYTNMKAKIGTTTNVEQILFNNPITITSNRFSNNIILYAFVILYFIIEHTFKINLEDANNKKILDEIVNDDVLFRESPQLNFTDDDIRCIGNNIFILNNNIYIKLNQYFHNIHIPNYFTITEDNNTITTIIIHNNPITQQSTSTNTQQYSSQPQLSLGSQPYSSKPQLSLGSQPYSSQPQFSLGSQPQIKPIKPIKPLLQLKTTAIKPQNITEHFTKLNSVYASDAAKKHNAKILTLFPATKWTIINPPGDGICMLHAIFQTLNLQIDISPFAFYSDILLRGIKYYFDVEPREKEIYPQTSEYITIKINVNDTDEQINTQISTLLKDKTLPLQFVTYFMYGLLDYDKYINILMLNRDQRSSGQQYIYSHYTIPDKLLTDTNKTRLPLPPLPLTNIILLNDSDHYKSLIADPTEMQSKIDTITNTNTLYNFW